MKISKVTDLPLIPNNPNEVVFVKDSSGVETFISNSLGDKFHKVISSKYSPRLSMPPELEISKDCYIYISNYDTFHTHTVSSLRGTIFTSSTDVTNVYELDDDEIFYTAPDTVGEDIITINGIEYKINIIEEYSGPGNTFIYYPSTEGSAFDTISGPFFSNWSDYFHQGIKPIDADYYPKKAIYQISSDKRFHNILLEDTVEDSNINLMVKSKIINLSNFLLYKTFYIRVKYVEGDRNDINYEKHGKWSPGVPFGWNDDQGSIPGPYYEVAQYNSVNQSLTFEPKTYGSVLATIMVKSGDVHVFVSDPSKSLNVLNPDTGLEELRNYQGTVSVYILDGGLLSYLYELPLPPGFGTKLNPADDAHRYFGFSLATDQNSIGFDLFVGSGWSVDSSSYMLTYHRYSFVNNNWIYIDDLSTGKTFIPEQISISANNSRIAIGVPYENLNDQPQVGCVLIYNLDNSINKYLLETTLFDTTPTDNYKFGSQVYMCDNGVYVTSESFSIDFNLPSRKVSYFEYNSQSLQLSYVNSFECSELDNGNYKRFGERLWATPDASMVIVSSPSYVDNIGCFYIYILSNGTFGSYGINIPDIAYRGDEIGCFMDVAYNDIDNYCTVTLSTKRSNKTYVYRVESPGINFNGMVTLIDDLSFNNDPKSNRLDYNGPAIILTSDGFNIAVGSYISLFDVNQNHRNILSLFQYPQG